MSLASGLFVLFISVVCVFSYAIPGRFRYLFLLLVSYAFYVYSPNGITENLPALGLLLFATLVSYACALGLQKAVQKNKRIVLLVLSLLSSLGMLVVFKYTNPILEFSGIGTEAFQLLLPLGMGYYTLQAASYAIDVYRHKIEAERNVFRYALYVSFFPGIVTGPINRASHMLSQYKEPRAFSYDFVSGGLFRILWGLVKKLVVADHLAKYTAVVLSNPQEQTGPLLVLAGLLFAYQLYADFSGSCDIAIGAARMLGFDFMENFKHPFAAKTYIDFWHRWHISLTSFFRDYLYIPLGGSRVGRFRWMMNTLVVFVVSALWHGEGVGYLVWGLLSGLFLVLAKVVQPHKERLVAHIPLYRTPAVRRVFQCIMVYIMVASTFLWFAFALYKTPVQAYILQLTTGWDMWGQFAEQLATLGLSGGIVGVLLFCIVLVACVEWRATDAHITVADWVRKQRWFARWPLYYGLLALLFAFGIFGQSTFIYQQF